MTIEEVCNKYKVAESSMKTQFKRTQESIFKKYGIRIIKEGRGSKAIYKEQIVSDNRAKNMFEALEPIHETGIIKKDLILPNFTFCVFMGVITTPMLVFRGTYNDFLSYIEVSINEQNIKFLKESIEELIQSHIINCIIDRSGDEEVITMSLVRAAEKDMKIGIDMIRTCKILATKYHKRDWIPLLKVWLGTELLSKNDFYTKQELLNMTGLSRYQLDECGKILKESNIYKTTKAYNGFARCLGLNADMNAKDFYIFS